MWKVIAIISIDFKKKSFADKLQIASILNVQNLLTLEKRIFKNIFSFKS